MAYRIYYTIPEQNANDKLPTKLLAREKWIETNQLDEVVEVEPSWLEYQEKNKGQFGVPVYRSYQGKKYLIVGLIPDFLGGIIDELYALGTGLHEPEFTVWGSAEQLNAFNWDTEQE